MKRFGLIKLNYMFCLVLFILSFIKTLSITNRKMFVMKSPKVPFVYFYIVYCHLKSTHSSEMNIDLDCIMIVISH